MWWCQCCIIFSLITTFKVVRNTSANSPKQYYNSTFIFLIQLNLVKTCQNSGVRFTVTSTIKIIWLLFLLLYCLVFLFCRIYELKIFARICCSMLIAAIRWKLSTACGVHLNMNCCLNINAFCFVHYKKHLSTQQQPYSLPGNNTTHVFMWCMVLDLIKKFIEHQQNKKKSFKIKSVWIMLPLNM